MKCYESLDVQEAGATAVPTGGGAARRVWPVVPRRIIVGRKAGAGRRAAAAPAGWTTTSLPAVHRHSQLKK